MIPRGTGFFINKSAALPDIKTTIKDLHSMNANYVFIKSAYRDQKVNASYKDMTSAISDFKKDGFLVYLWHFVCGGVKYTDLLKWFYFGASVEKEVSVAKQSINEFSPDGFIINAEIEFMGKSQFERADKFMYLLGNQNIPIALSSFRFPTAMPTFPWKQFMNHCDIVMPQIYWQPTNGKTLGVIPETNRSVSEFRSILLDDGKEVSIIPTGRAYIGDGHPNPTGKEITEYLNLIKDMNLIGSSFWGLDYIYTHSSGKDCGKAISEFSWEKKIEIKNEDVTPVVPSADSISDTKEEDMRKLIVPFVSQIQEGATEHNNDCGGASSLMLLNAYELLKEKTVDYAYNQMQSSGDVALSATQIINFMKNEGLSCEWKYEQTIQNLFEYLVAKKPVIALIHYGTLVDAGFTEIRNFRGAHWIVVSGIDIENVYVRDPYRTTNTDVEIPISVFVKSWNDSIADGNPIGGLIVPKIPIQDLSSNNGSGEIGEPKKHKTTTVGLAVYRNQGGKIPSNSTNMTKVIQNSGTIVDVYEENTTWARISSDEWVKKMYLKIV